MLVAAQRGIAKHASEDRQRELEPIRFLRVDRERDAGRERGAGEPQQRSGNRFDRARALRALVARM
jgi:hypothetical protein